jgi:hypothetical protein
MFDDESNDLDEIELLMELLDLTDVGGQGEAKRLVLIWAVIIFMVKLERKGERV